MLTQFGRRTFVEILSTLCVLMSVPMRAAGKTVDVSMKNQPEAMFDPASVSVEVGDTVRWTNPELITHTVTFDPAKAANATHAALPNGVVPFDSGDLEQDSTYVHAFTVKGVYKYFCKYHEEMKMFGTVVVS